MKIAVFGTGYVGLSLSILLAQNNQVFAVDIVEEKVNKINNKISPIEDKQIQHFFHTKKLNLFATLNGELALEGSDFLIIATPTNYDPETNCFDTSSVEKVIHFANSCGFKGTIVIKSTVPVGFTKKLNEMGYSNVIFSPEFLREGHALEDNLYPSRIVVGGDNEKSKKFADLLLEGAIKKDTHCFFTNSTEAEAIKLFSNTYLAMRISFFNELDSFALAEGLNTKQIIDGVSSDPRIGNNYCNPSFGYGGYCLPKDTKQLLSNYERVPQELIRATVESNKVRKDFISETVLKLKPKVVGIFRLVMKKNSDNFRESAIFDIIENLAKNDLKIVIYEPNLEGNSFRGNLVLNDISQFKKESDIILANRWDESLKDVRSKVFTRDVFFSD